MVVGGGAAGMFAAIQAAKAGAAVTVLERTGRCLEKVRISGGGRCNVTHACFEPRDLATRYPRGGQALLSPLQRFSARDTVEWFQARGVELKTEADGRMFPVTDNSQTIVDCLLTAAGEAGVQIRLNAPVQIVRRTADGRFALTGGMEAWGADAVLLATGGCRSALAGQLAVGLGHTLEEPVPSLFTFQIETPWLRGLAGVAGEAEVFAAGRRERGPVLVTHWGLSGPAILRLSAWEARTFSRLNYQFPLVVNWLPGWKADQILEEFLTRRARVGAKWVVNGPFAPLTARLWEQLVLAAGISRETKWGALNRIQTQSLVRQLTATEFAVTGKSLNKDEFVTCGGVRLDEVNFKRMESKRCPGLFFAGELLDIDGVTGGFNFQAAWTTGYVAGTAMGSGGLA